MSDQRAPETAGAWRVVRGTVVGAAATGLALGAHAVADGGVPPLAAVAATALGVGLVSVGLSRFRWTVPRLLVLLMVTQPLLHTIFGAAEPMPAGHRHGLMGAGAEETIQLQSPMLAAHAVAALATALLLRRGEAWFCHVLDALALRAIRLLRDCLPVYGVRPQPVPIRAHHLPRQHFPAQAWWQRGPPR